MIYDTIIIGGGIAAYSAGIYAARYLLKTLILEKEFGGETATASWVENYPGFKEIKGSDLMQKIREQAESLKLEIKDKSVIEVSRKNHCFFAKTPKKVYQSQTIILAIGTARRHLGLAREKELEGRGVSYCATCDAPLFKGKVVGVVGGGDAALTASVLLSHYAKKVYLIVRGPKIKAEPINLKEFRQRNNIEVVRQAEVSDLLGREFLEGVILGKPHKGNARLNLNGLFVEIGSIPLKEIPLKLHLKLDERGFIDVDKFMRTNIDGVFAAGDATNAAGDFKQIITAAAQGAIAATSVYKDLGVHHSRPCLLHSKINKKLLTRKIK